MTCECTVHERCWDEHAGTTHPDLRALLSRRGERAAVGVQEAIHLTHKAFAVLHYLAEHAGQLVTKDALLEVVVPDPCE